MKCTVVVTERIDGNFHATVPGFPDCVIDAPTRDEALRKVHSTIQSVIDRSEIFQIDVDTDPKLLDVKDRTPWEYYGRFKDDPFWAKVFDEIEQS